MTIVLAIGQHCHSQGFINLDFESAHVVLDASSPYYPYAVYANTAIPGWTAYYGTTNNPTYVSLSSISYNDMSLGAANVSLEDTNAIYGPLPIQGKYSILLQGSIPAAVSSASIGQTGTIPVTAQSLTFIGYFGGQVTFNGQPLDYLVTGSTANYNIYAADISVYAGQTGQLLFTATVNTSALLDNIQFSSTPVPEPSVFVLTALGGLLLGCRRWRDRSR